jgi:hypothetical protein
MAMQKEIRRTKKKIQSKTKTKTNKQTNKQTKVYHVKEMNGKKIKAIQKENEIRKVVIRTQRWRLRIKLLKDNADKQPTVPEENTYNSRSNCDREKKV